MGRTPDRAPGPSVEEETQYEDRTADGNPTVDGAVRYVSGDLVVKLPTGVVSLSSGTGSPHPVHVDTIDPAIDDDSGSGYQVGGHWVNTATLPPRTFQAVDVTVGAAVWKRVTNLKQQITSTDPAAGNDNTEGYEVGSLWANTTAPSKTFVMLDSSTGAAVWKRITNTKLNITTTDPAVENDNTEGYEISSVWVNTAALPPRTWAAVDVSTGAAIWKRISNLKHTITDVDPDADNDGTEDYEIGSLWYNTSAQNLHICLDPTTSSAVWRTIGDPGTHTLPGTVFYGASVATYPTTGSDLADEIQYVAVRLQANKQYDRMAVYVATGGIAGRTIQLGVYDQTAPYPLSNPANRVARTDSVGTAGADGTYYQLQLTDGAGTPQPYTVPVTGIYWLAMTQNSNAVTFAATGLFRGGFITRRQQTGASALLPAAASGLSSPDSALLLVALLEPGVVVPT